MPRCSALILTLLVCLAGTASAGEALVVVPSEVKLADAYSRRQLLVSLDGKDVTSQGRFESSNAAVVEADAGYVVPKSAGAATITILLGDRSHNVGVTIEQFEEDRPVDFAADVMPLLSRHGCNAGGCHGKASGQNGFK